MLTVGEFDRLVNTILKGYATAYQGTTWGAMAGSLSSVSWEAVLSKLPAAQQSGAKVTAGALIYAALNDVVAEFDLVPLDYLPEPLRTLQGGAGGDVPRTGARPRRNARAARGPIRERRPYYFRRIEPERLAA